MKVIRCLSAVMVGVCLTGFAVMSAQSQVAAPEQSPAAIAKIPKCAVPPKMDGELDDECWKSATVFTNFFDLDKHEFSGNALEACATYDKAWFYIAFRVKQSAAQRIRPPEAMDHDSLVQRDDCLKLYFDPGTGGKCYYLFKLNTLNVRQERRVINDSSEIAWDIPWRSAVKLGPDAWTAEMAIPFSQIPPWSSLDKASFDLLNTRFEPDGKGGTTKSRWSLAPQYEALKGSIVDPANFIRAQWTGGLEPAAPFLPLITSATAGQIRAADGGKAFDITLKLKSFSGPGGNVKLLIEETIGGKTTTIEKNIAIPKNSGELECVVPMKITSLLKRDIAVKMISDNGEILQLLPIDCGKSFEFLTAFTELNYYTAEKEANIVYEINLARDALGGKKLAVHDQAGKILAQSEALSPKGHIPVPLAGLADGRHELEARLADPEGVIQTAAVPLLKRPPKPGREWKVLRTSGAVLRNGAPFIPFGIDVHQNNASSAKFKDVAEIGFDSVAYWPYNMEPENLNIAIRQAAENKLTAYMYLEGPALPVGEALFEKYFKGQELDYCKKKFSTSTLTSFKCHFMVDPLLSMLPEQTKENIFWDYFKTNQTRLMGGISNVMNEPNLAAYMQFDEPGPLQFKAMTELYQDVNNTDGYHPVIAIYDSPAISKYADIMLHRSYWTPATPGLYGSVNWVTSVLVPISRSARQKHMGCWFVLPIATTFSGRHQRGFTPEEMRCQSYLALIHGAKGVYFFAYPIAHVNTRQAFSEVAREIKEMTPFVGAADINQEVKYSEGEYDLCKGPFPEIQCRLFRNEDSQFLLLAANTSHDTPVEAAFDLGGLVPDGKVKRLFNDGTHTVENGRIKDRFEPLGLRAYRFKAAVPSDGQTVMLKVTMRPLKESAQKRQFSLACTTIGPSENFMRNPSFEQAALPGAPDYFSFYNIPPGHLLGMPDAVYQLDPMEKVDGKVSLKISVGPEKNELRGFITYTPLPNTPKPMDYVFSLSMKTDQTGVVAQVRMAGDTHKIKVEKEWKRYSFTCTVPATPNPENNLFVELFAIGQPYTVWFDALQMERGTEPTPFKNPPEPTETEK